MLVELAELLAFVAIIFLFGMVLFVFLEAVGYLIDWWAE
jgi:hypothetical protein